MLLLTSNLMRYDVLEVLMPFKAHRNVAGGPFPPSPIDPPPPPPAQTHQM